LVQKITSGVVKGLSPGYKTETRQVDSATFEQFNRRGNHAAVVLNPRGGAGVEAVLAGVRMDSEDSLLWICDSVEDLHDAHPPSAEIVDYMVSGRNDVLLLEKSPIVLNLKSPMKTEMTDETCTGKDCQCDECTAAKTTKKKKKPMFTTDGADLSPDITAIVDRRIDAAIELQEQIRLDAEAMADKDEEIASLKARLETAEDLLDEANEALDEMNDFDEDQADSADDDDDEDGEDEIHFDSLEEFAEVAGQLITDFQQLRSDAALLGTDLVEKFGSEAAAISNFVMDAQSWKSEMIQAVAPNVRVDSLNDEAIDTTYEIAMMSVRDRQSAPRQDSYVSALATVGAIGGRTAAPAKTLGAAFLATNGAK
jgi:hypothetical protein